MSVQTYGSQSEATYWAAVQCIKTGFVHTVRQAREGLGHRWTFYKVNRAATTEDIVAAESVIEASS